MSRDGFDRLDKLGFAVLGLLFVAMAIRSVGSAADVQEAIGAIGGIVLLGLVVVWRYTSWRLPSRQEGVVTIGVGLVLIALLVVLAPDDVRMFDVGLVAGFLGFFLYGIVRVIGPAVA